MVCSIYIKNHDIIIGFWTHYLNREMLPTDATIVSSWTFISQQEYTKSSYMSDYIITRSNQCMMLISAS